MSLANDSAARVAAAGVGAFCSQAFASLNMPGNQQTADQIKATVETLGNVGDAGTFFDTTAFARVTDVRFGNVGRNTTIVRSNYLWDETSAIYEHSLKLWEGLPEELEYDFLFSQRGVMNLAHTLQDVRDSVRRVSANKLNGIDAEWISPEQVKELCPIINIGDDIRYPVMGATYQPRAGIAKHDHVAWAFARKCDEMGVDIIQNCEVVAMRRDASGRIAAVETTRGTIGAKRVGVAAAGHTRSPAEVTRSGFCACSRPNPICPVGVDSPASNTSPKARNRAAAHSGKPMRSVRNRASAGRSAGEASRARSVSFWRSRSNVRPMASVPEKAIAIQRMAGAASSCTSTSPRSSGERTATRAPCATPGRRRAPGLRRPRGARACRCPW